MKDGNPIKKKDELLPSPGVRGSRLCLSTAKTSALAKWYVTAEGSCKFRTGRKKK